MSEENFNPYQILELSDEDKKLVGEEFNKKLKSQFRKLCLKYHPDKNPDNKEAEEKFKQINEANSILCNPELRERYDRTGTIKQGPSGFDMGGMDVDLQDILHNFMGGGNPFSGRQRKQNHRIGQSIRITIQITLEEMFNGVHKKIKYNKSVKCDTCKGTGGPSAKCDVCHGSGVEIISQAIQFGTFQQSIPCRKCHGEGEISLQPCVKCGGTGTTIKEETVEFDLPIGILEGDTLIMYDNGHEVKNGTKPGDLHIAIEEIEHDKFERKGNDLVYVYDAQYYDLILGATIEIPTIEGTTIKINVPEGTDINKTFRLQGKGMKDKMSSDHRGDMYVVINLIVLKEVSNEVKEILKKLKKIVVKEKLIA